MFWDPPLSDNHPTTFSPFCLVHEKTSNFFSSHRGENKKHVFVDTENFEKVEKTRLATTVLDPERYADVTLRSPKSCQKKDKMRDSEKSYQQAQK